MTRRAIGRRGGKAGVCRVTGKTGRVTDRDGFECSFLYPERVTERRRWLGQIFVARFTLRPHRGMTDGAAFFGSTAGGKRGGCENRPGTARSGNDIDVLLVRERDLEIRRRGLSLRGQIKYLSRIRKRMS